MPSTGNFLTADSRRGFFGTRIASALARSCSRRVKRLIYISSIMGLLEQVKDPDMQVVGKLNEIFKIAKHPEAFTFPMYIKSFIWKDVGNMAVQVDEQTSLAIPQILSCDLSTRECTAIGEHFAKRAPAWLKYASLELMVEDVVRLVHQLKSFHAQPAMRRA